MEDTNSKVDEIYTIDEVAELMQVHRDTVIEWMRIGKLGRSKIGHKTVRIYRSDIDTFMKSVHEKATFVKRDGKATIR